MKKGDKLYCIKTLIHYNKIFFYENKIYQIESVDNYNIKIINDQSISYLASSFHLSPFNYEDDYNFYEHFITMKKLRKLKLLKINENKRSNKNFSIIRRTI